MSDFVVTSTSRLGVDQGCMACGAGATISFNWALAIERKSSDDAKRGAPFVYWRSLRRGSLYRCNVCDEVWHLDGEGQLMTHVNSARLTVVMDWNREALKLTAALEARLELIGPTPPDTYGNWSDRRVTPCRVVTRAGELVDPAMICVQLDAPVQDNMHFRGAVRPIATSLRLMQHSFSRGQVRPSAIATLPERQSGWSCRSGDW